LLGLGSVVIAALFAVVLFGLAVEGERFGAWLGRGPEALGSGALWKLVLALLGLALVYLVVKLVLRALGLGETRTIEFDGPAGQMVVEASNLEQCVRRTELEDRDVADATARVRIPSGVSAQIRRRFLQIIPIETDPVVNLDVKIRAPRPGTEAAKATQPMAAAETEEPQRLPDVPDFTGERRYGGEAAKEKREVDDDEEGKRTRRRASDAG
jgi:hypothetical protein